MLIKPAEGVSYAAILNDLKKRVKPEEVGITVQQIRETHSKDLLVKLKSFNQDRGQKTPSSKSLLVQTDFSATLSSELRLRMLNRP